MYKYLDIVTASFVAVLLLSNIVTTKLLQFGPIIVSGGLLLFPLAYIFGDILVEVYGYKVSRRVIYTGFAWLFLSSILFMALVAAPYPSEWEHQEAVEVIFGLTPRIMLASMIAYWVGSFVNSFVLAKLKVMTNGKLLWVRTIGSTVVGQTVDTVVFAIFAFWGVFSVDILVNVVISEYLIKVLIEALFTPITYQVVNRLKYAERVDRFDRDTNFNPFLVNDIHYDDKLVVDKINKL